MLVRQVRGELPLNKCKVALDSVEFSDKVSDEEMASKFADIVTQMALDVSYHFRSHYILLFCSVFFLLGSSNSKFCTVSEKMQTKKGIKIFCLPFFDR